MDKYQEKLSEAKYHLMQMEQRREDRDAFHYELRAFLFSSRSILQYAEAETKGGKGQTWFQKQMKDRHLQYARDLRDEDTHEQPLTTLRNHRMTVSAGMYVVKGSDTAMYVTRGDGSIEQSVYCSCCDREMEHKIERVGEVYVARCLGFECSGSQTFTASNVAELQNAIETYTTEKERLKLVFDIDFRGNTPIEVTPMQSFEDVFRSVWKQKPVGEFCQELHQKLEAFVNEGRQLGHLG
ncbi:MAG: hypothetical protein Q8921_03200 [Bacteroidota bacterium]|nr:hypothetical protein [Bacteroidota bacterium]